MSDARIEVRGHICKLISNAFNMKKTGVILIKTGVILKKTSVILKKTGVILKKTGVNLKKAIKTKCPKDHIY